MNPPPPTRISPRRWREIRSSAKSFALAGVLLAAVIVGSAIAPKPPSSPHATMLPGAQLPLNVRATLERSCRDCHSDATHYPWYSYIAPVSWLIRRDVRMGRERLNFSKWANYPVLRRERYLSEIANQVQDGGMPLAVYTLMHRDARLSKSDVQAVFEWTQAERARMILENAAGAQSK